MRRVCLALLAVATVVFFSRAYADDPCIACGRLIIQIVGAGEIPNRNTYEPSTPEYRQFNAFINDPIEHNAISHLKQFAPLPNGKLPVQIILISSDSSLNKRAKSLSQLTKTKLRILPNTTGSLKSLTEIEHSELRNALAALEAGSACRNLMKKKGLKSVVPLLKVEILIESEFGVTEALEPGIPTWSSSSKSGSNSDWRADGGHVITLDDWKALIAALHGATIHTYINSCRSGAFASTFESRFDDNGCSCFIASTNRTQNDYGGGSFTPWLNGAIRDRDDFEKSPANIWEGGRNVFALLPFFYNKHEAMIFPKGKDNPYLYTQNLNPRNPLNGFIYTSADALADEGLMKLGSVSDPQAFVWVRPSSAKGEVAVWEQLRDKHLFGLPTFEVKALSGSGNYEENARGAFWAQVTNELPSVTEDVGSSNEKAKQIRGQIAAINRAYASIYDEDDGRSSSLGTFVRNFNSFMDCALLNEGKSQQCKDLDAYASSLFAMVSPSEEQVSFKRSYNGFMKELDASRPVPTWRDCVDNKISVGQAFENLHKVRMTYLDLVKDFSAVIKKSSAFGEVNGTVEPAFNRMTDDFESAYSAIKKPMFLALRKDALRLKLAKIEIATQLVAQHADALPPGYAEEFLKKMSRKLDCLTKVPVGPMFDKEAAALNARRQ
jgi:hypothetical protein